MSYCSECKLSSGIHDSDCPAMYKRSLRIIKQKLATANSRNKELEAALEKICDNESYDSFCGDDCVRKAQQIAKAALDAQASNLEGKKS